MKRSRAAGGAELLERDQLDHLVLVVQIDQEQHQNDRVDDAVNRAGEGGVHGAHVAESQLQELVAGDGNHDGYLLIAEAAHKAGKEQRTERVEHPGNGAEVQEAGYPGVLDLAAEQESGQTSQSTAMGEDGLLTVAADEPSGILTVKATYENNTAAATVSVGGLVAYFAPEGG